jgi:hypothetical protein
LIRRARFRELRALDRLAGEVVGALQGLLVDSRPSALASAPIWVSGIFAPIEADAATVLPTVESSLRPSRRLTSRATELRVWNCVLVEPPSDVLVAPDLCWERS